MQRLFAQLDNYEFISYGEWQRIVTLWFVEPKVRRKTLDLIGWARVGRARADPKSDPDEPEFITKLDEWDAEAGIDDPVYAIRGLPEHLRSLTLDQVGRDLDLLRESGQGLDVQGYRSSVFKPQPLDALDLHERAFIRGAKPGKPISVTGSPDSGKTHFIMNYIAAPALKAGWVVVSNVKVARAPADYHHVATFAKGIATAIHARLDNRRVMLIRDEGGADRSRGDATSREARSQKKVALRLYRKIDCVEIYSNQLPRDVPHEVAATRSHAFHKVSQDSVECWTPTLRGVVRGLQSNKQLEADGRPFLDYDTRDPSPWDPSADIMSIVDYEFALRDASWEEHMAVIAARLDRIGSSALVDDPLSLEQIRRLVLHEHLHDTRQSHKSYFGRFDKDLLGHGVSNAKALWELMRSEWKVWSHPEDILKACGYCLGHHPRLRMDAARAAAATPPETPPDV